MKLTIDSILVMSEHQQISDNVEQVAKEIKDYNRENDLAVLEKLRDLCIKENMTVETAKMYRNIGMYYFYTNDFNNAIISMQLAVDLLAQENCTGLLIEYYSVIGLIYFYKNEYLYSRRYYEKVEGLLSQAADINKQIIHLHYYRYGILLSNMHEYAISEEKFEKALLYAEDKRDIGATTMNLGVLHKRQGEYKAALKFYSKALYLLDSKDLRTKSIVYNNISELYKVLGQYEKALKFIYKAFNYIKDNDLSLLFVYFDTYSEIKLLMGERESVLDEFLKLLVRVKDFHIYNGFIIKGINNMIMIGSEDRNILSKIKDAIIELIEDNTYDNEEYIKELKACIVNIQLCLKELED